MKSTLLAIFTRSSSNEGSKAPRVDPHKDLGIMFDPGPMGRSKPSDLNTQMFRDMIWPNAENLDPFEIVRYKKLVSDWAEHITHYPHFDICTIDRICDLFGVDYHAKHLKHVYDKLRLLHCVDWKHIPPEILGRIPSMASYIINNGRTTLEAQVVN